MQLVKAAIARRKLMELGLPLSRATFYRMLENRSIPAFFVNKDDHRLWFVPRGFIEQVAENFASFKISLLEVKKEVKRNGSNGRVSARCR